MTEWFELKVKEQIQELEIVAKIQKWADDEKELPPELKVAWTYHVIPDPRELAQPELGTPPEVMELWMEEAMIHLHELRKDPKKFKSMFKEKLYSFIGETPEQLKERDPLDQLLVTYQVIFDIYLNV